MNREKLRTWGTLFLSAMILFLAAPRLFASVWGLFPNMAVKAPWALSQIIKEHPVLLPILLIAFLIVFLGVMKAPLSLCLDAARRYRLRRWYRKAAEQAARTSYIPFGGINLQKDEDPKVIFEWLRKSAKTGDAQGQYYTGHALENGIGCKKSLRKAVKWYKKAADQGDEDAIAALRRLGRL